MSHILRFCFVLVFAAALIPSLALAEGSAEGSAEVSAEGSTENRTEGRTKDSAEGEAVAAAEAVSEEGPGAGSEASVEGNLALHIAGLQDVSGNVYIAVYDSAETWLSKDTLLERRVVITDSLQEGLVRTTLQLPKGRYALTVFYDRDDDGKLDTNFIGMPKEPIALSNNAKAKFGPPKFEDAAFELGEEPVLQTINMEEL